MTMRAFSTASLNIEQQVNRLAAALRDHEPILLSLNMEMEAEGGRDIILGMQDRVYVPVASVADYLAMREKIIAAIRESDVRPDIQVSFKGRTLSHDEFDIHCDHEKSQELYKHLTTRRRGECFFPRFITFLPSKGLRMSGEGIRGHFCNIPDSNKVAMFKLNLAGLAQKNPAAREGITNQLLIPGGTCMIVRPWLETERVGSRWDFAGLTVHGIAQIAPAPENRDSLLLPATKKAVPAASQHDQPPSNDAPAGQMGLFQ